MSFSAPPSYTSQPPYDPRTAEQPTRYRVEGNNVYAQVPVYPNPSPQAQLQALVPYQQPIVTGGQTYSYPYPYSCPTPVPVAMPMAAPAAPATFLVPQAQPPYSLTQSYSTLPFSTISVPPQHAPYTRTPPNCPPGYKLRAPTSRVPLWTAEPIDSHSGSGKSKNKGVKTMRLTCRDPDKERLKKIEREEKKKLKAKREVVRVVLW